MPKNINVNGKIIGTKHFYTNSTKLNYIYPLGLNVGTAPGLSSLYRLVLGNVYDLYCVGVTTNKHINR
jgi:hypothetical protein